MIKDLYKGFAKCSFAGLTTRYSKVSVRMISVSAPPLTTRSLLWPYRAITTIGSKHPLAFGALVAMAKTGCADLIVQKYVDRVDKIDKRRFTLFCLWGLLWLGFVQYFVYVKLYSLWFPNVQAFARKSIRAKIADTHGQLTVVKQVLFDALIHMPWFYLPAFYTLKSFLETEGAMSMNGYLREAMVNYRSNFRNDVKVFWQWWVPALIVNFSICPLWMRIPFVAGVSFFFTMYWSFLHGEPIEQELNKSREVKE